MQSRRGGWLARAEATKRDQPFDKNQVKEVAQLGAGHLEYQPFREPREVQMVDAPSLYSSKFFPALQVERADRFAAERWCTAG